MISYIHNRIQDKTILVLGFGREGKSTLKTLLQAGGAKKIAIGDVKELDLSSEALKDPCFEGLDLSVIGFCCGDDYQDYIDQFDIVMKSPGIVLNKNISEYSAQILSQMQLIFEFYRNQIVGITGTKGKSTTTTLLHHILKESGRDAILAGNIGIPVFDIIPEIKKDSLLVLELSCHQLEYMTVSPKWGILLNIYEEHLDHYGTMEKYVASKEKIYVNQKEKDLLFVSPEVKPRPNEHQGICKLIDDKKLKYDSTNLTILYEDRFITVNKHEINLLGAHNYLDIAFDYGVCVELGISDEEFVKGLKTYVPLPHRLQYIGTVNEVRYYDDSISTIDETAIQALKTLEDADTILLGGMDRGISYVNLEEFLAHDRIPHIILMEATGKRIYEEIQRDFKDFEKPERLLVVEHLEDAVKLAKEITKKGSSCVLSPAAASYGIFKNFEERGDVFKKLVLEK